VPLAPALGGFKTVASGFSRTSGPPEGGHHVVLKPSRIARS